MWNADRYRLCACGSMQQARCCRQSLQVSFMNYYYWFTNIDYSDAYIYRIFPIIPSSSNNCIGCPGPRRVKKQAQDRPMSMWISSIKQLEPVKHLLSPLLLDFMEAAWPSSISMVIPRGMTYNHMWVCADVYIVCSAAKKKVCECEITTLLCGLRVFTPR